MGLNSIPDIVRVVATAKGYSPADIAAGVEYAARKTRRSHPPGQFDRAGRFYASEPFHTSVRPPSRDYPYSQLVHARTAVHVAHVFGADEVATRRIGKMTEKAWEVEEGGLSNHQALTFASDLSRGLKAASTRRDP